MNETDTSRLYAFLTSYLLGVSRYTLSNRYMDDYTKFNELSLVNEVVDAKIVRLLSKVRNTVIKQYETMRAEKSFRLIADDKIGEDLAVLDMYGIDFYAVYDENSHLSDVLNQATKNINMLLNKAMNSFKFPFIEQITSLFYMPEFTEDTLAKFAYKFRVRSDNYPFGLPLYRGEKLGRYLKFTLVNDKNLFASSFNLTTGTYPKSLLTLPKYDWERILTRPEIDELNVVENQPLVLSVSNGSIFYVDCDNVDALLFLLFLDTVKESSTQDDSFTVKLFVDEISNPVWSVVKILIGEQFSVEEFRVSRIRGSKSFVDIALTAQLARDSVLSESKQYIVSSDSDYAGVIESNTNVTVVYDTSSTSLSYIEYLNSKNVSCFNINKVFNEERMTFCKNMLYTSMCLAQLASLPMNRWDEAILADALVTRYISDTCNNISMTETTAKEIASKVLSDLKVTRQDGIKLEALGTEVEIPIHS